jgi:HAE1 family hydrophobic/amphiphilic exporter-1
MQGMQLPYGYSWTFGSWEERRKENQQEFLTNLMLALLLIFAVMASIFESVRQAITLLVSLPFALAGAFWTLWLTKTDFDQPAAVGLLLLIGTVVNNGIVMLAHVNHYRNQGYQRHDALLRGCRERLRPVVMTALTTMISLLPMVIQKPSLGGVYYYSMALVIMGGLLLSTFLTLILLPTATTLVEDGTRAVVRLVLWIAILLRLRKRQEALAD